MCHHQGYMERSLAHCKAAAILNDIRAVAEVNVACFDSALLTYCGVRAVRRNKGTVIAEAEIKASLEVAFHESWMYRLIKPPGRVVSCTFDG